MARGLGKSSEREGTLNTLGPNGLTEKRRSLPGLILAVFCEAVDEETRRKRKKKDRQLQRS
jgi:hypothetical protein